MIATAGFFHPRGPAQELRRLIDAIEESARGPHARKAAVRALALLHAALEELETGDAASDEEAHPHHP